MKKQFILFILLFCCFSCASQKKEVIAKSTIKLEGRNTNIRDLMEIDGYYSSLGYENDGGTIFFEDGTWVAFSFKRDISENEIRVNLSKSVRSWEEDKQIRWGSYWGVYKIEGDTLIMFKYDKGNFWKGWSLYEYRKKIIDRTTLKETYRKSLLKNDETYYRDLNINVWVDGFYSQFFPADSLPSSDNWLKEEKWIWRNEQDWKDYMQKIEQKKNKRK
jgi:hypothetical protein